MSGAGHKRSRAEAFGDASSPATSPAPAGAAGTPSRRRSTGGAASGGRKRKQSRRPAKSRAAAAAAGWGGEPAAGYEGPALGSYDPAASIPASVLAASDETLLVLSRLAPLLASTRSPWFPAPGARVLDVGCGAGYGSLVVAEALRPAVVIGVDVSPRLVARARDIAHERQLVLASRGAREGSSGGPATAAAIGASPYYRVEDFIASGPSPREGVGSSSSSSDGGAGLAPGATAAPAASAPVAAEGAQEDRGRDGSTSASSSSAVTAPVSPPLRSRTGSVAAAASQPPRLPPGRPLLALSEGSNYFSHPPGYFDLALCINVTKWVHLRGGDRALVLLFRRLHASLRTGGLLVLLAQDWASYTRTGESSAAAAATTASLRLRPAEFLWFLTERLKFELVATLQGTAPPRSFGTTVPGLGPRLTLPAPAAPAADSAATGGAAASGGLRESERRRLYVLRKEA